MFLPCVAVNQATVSITVVNIATTIKATDTTATIANPTILIEMINATFALNGTTRTQRALTYNKKDDRKHNHFKR